MSWVTAQQPPRRPQGRPSRVVAVAVGVATPARPSSPLVDANKDGAVTRDEMKATFDKWFTEWDSAKTGRADAGTAPGRPECRAAGAAFPAGRAVVGPQGQNQTPTPEHVQAMLAALPATAPAKPKQPRKVLVLSKAGGFVHSSIPLADEPSKRWARRPARGHDDHL